MSVPAKNTQLYLGRILDALRPSYEGKPKKELLIEVASRLGSLAGESWTWRYVQSVLSGNGVTPSPKFSACVSVLHSVLIDGVPSLIAGSEKVEVYAPPGNIHPGAVVLGRSRPCSNPACTVHFVAKSGHQLYCQPACRKHAWWIRKLASRQLKKKE